MVIKKKLYKKKWLNLISYRQKKEQENTEKRILEISPESNCITYRRHFFMCRNYGSNF